jgi:hypothetical protein
LQLRDHLNTQPEVWSAAALGCRGSPSGRLVNRENVLIMTKQLILS